MRTLLTTTILGASIAFVASANAGNMGQYGNNHNHQPMTQDAPAPVYYQQGEEPRTLQAPSNYRQTQPMQNQGYEARDQQRYENNAATTANPYANQQPAAGNYPQRTMDYVAPSTNLLQEKNGIAYATGGVGEEEMSALKSYEPKFNVKVLSTRTDGAYLGDYSVSFMNTSGDNVLTVPANGPLVYAALPAGTYTVQSNLKSMDAKSQKVSVNNGLKTLQFRWNNGESDPFR